MFRSLEAASDTQLASLEDWPAGKDRGSILRTWAQLAVLVEERSGDKAPPLVVLTEEHSGDRTLHLAYQVPQDQPDILTPETEPGLRSFQA